MDEGDAEAMYLLGHYYSPSNEFSYVPENYKMYQMLTLKAAKLGHWDAISQILSDESALKVFYMAAEMKKEINALKPVIAKGIKNKDPKAYIVMSDLLDQPINYRNFSAEQCQWLYQGYRLGDIWDAGYRLRSCGDDDLKKMKAPSSQEFSQMYDNNVLKEIQTYKQIAQPTLKQKTDLLNKIGWNQAEEFAKFSEKLQKEIKDFYIQQGKQGYSDAYIYIAKDHLEFKDKKPWYEKAAKLNNPIALTALGDAYLYPDDEKQKPNPKLGIQYLEKAIQLNDVEAMNTLAVWYNNESKKEQDQEQAEKLYLHAAQLGYVVAMQNLARVLDEPESYKWASIAFQNGSRDEEILPMAYQAYAEGIGVKKDPKIAAEVQQLIDRIENNDQNFRKAVGLGEE
ncbi:tetratricopeptide repeat protein [Acinetobacter sp. CFCC 10889]|uniref:tetratricopeptide repeat protein n=1 Tax=Acinetobacter sp. CFCC 10889 TaxID=1775557 RepID=UPI0013A6D32C|nr:SEL1-like repeat protein [Acinetobacter sp. CFCC 10889]